jgi:prepilin-type N-terminal cleavage/methylation domain-containing protein
MGPVREPSAERGFTLIELMIVVAIVAILAVVVVPTFLKSANKTKGKTEVTAMFAEIAMKEEAYKSESPTNTYLAAAKCHTGGAQKTAYNFQTTCITTGSAWETLRIQPPESSMYCAYQVFVGTKTDPLLPPGTFKNSRGSAGTAEPSLSSGWWYVVADCDEDSHGGTNAKYYMSSLDQVLQVTNSGS